MNIFGRTHGARPTPASCAWSTGATNGKRVVVESDDAAVGWAVGGVLQREGYEVVQCPGPDAGHRCPVLDGGRCQLVADADVVINLLGGDHTDGIGPAVRTALRSAHPDTPVVAELSVTATAARDDALAAGVHVVDAPVRAVELSQVVAALVEDVEPSCV
jgi:hypothetical protein